MIGILLNRNQNKVVSHKKKPRIGFLLGVERDNQALYPYMRQMPVRSKIQIMTGIRAEDSEGEVRLNPTEITVRGELVN